MQYHSDFVKYKSRIPRFSRKISGLEKQKNTLAVNFRLGQEFAPRINFDLLFWDATMETCLAVGIITKGQKNSPAVQEARHRRANNSQGGFGAFVKTRLPRRAFDCLYDNGMLKGNKRGDAYT